MEWGPAGQGIKPGQGLLRYRFEIKTPGAYQVFIRGKMLDPENRPDTLDLGGNDIWMKLDGGKNVDGAAPLKQEWNKVAILGHPKQWTWNTNLDVDKSHPITPVMRRFESGVHTLELCGRSQGYAIDRVLILRRDDSPITDFDSAALVPYLERQESEVRN